MTENEIETDFIGGEEVPRPDIDTVRRWLSRARAQGRLEGMQEVKTAGLTRELRETWVRAINRRIAAAERDLSGGKEEQGE